MNRVTSVYTLHVEVTHLYCPATHGNPGEDNTTHHISGPSCRYCGFKPSVIRREALRAIAAALPQVQDQGEHTLSFRATGDPDAIQTARLAGAGHLTITTGLGIHRRTVGA